MLVLTRKSGESLIVGEDVIITVVEIKGGQVKLGVDAPKSIAIYRKELLEKIIKQNIAAAKSGKIHLSYLAKLVKKKTRK